MQKDSNQNDDQKETPKQQEHQQKTLYIRNINEKIKLRDLKKQLETLFSKYGTILKIIAYRSLRMKGQAFVIFEDINSAISAKEKLQGYNLQGKSIQIQFSRSKSDIIAEKEGNLAEHLERRKRKKEERKRKEQAKKREKQTEKVAKPRIIQTSRMPTQTTQVQQPNRILYLENLPKQMTVKMLDLLFQRFPGYVSSQLVPGNRAFVEFQHEIGSIEARNNLQGYQLSEGYFLNISFAKK
ncbi:u1 small nuclear ribonucleoprotein a [Anaeramoeba ignava]|uniref:U1 small nuclear ribonucleoprotein a n=1 Tax=Anaeramoeba ignava TaxID=1746090 RepID=A0A9Q0LM49_ANAIG|nr:u1 small nuclear ribonucleoprotein a [Anaeramoeba ignava]